LTKNDYFKKNIKMIHLKNHKVINDEERALLTKCKKAIKSIEPSAEVILYGSRARGDAEPDSDFDLLILVDGEVTLEREDLIYRQLYPIELDTGKVLSAIVYNRDQWNSSLYRVMPFHKNVEREGVVL
jgi:predicted nucleotidyltransferase